MNRVGFDESGYWRKYVCPECDAETLQKSVNETDGLTPEDLQNMSEFNRKDYSAL